MVATLSGVGDKPPRYWDHANRLINDKHANRARRGRECPICGSADWCLFDSEAALCPRSDGTGSPKKYGEYGFLHVFVEDAAQYVHPGYQRPPKRPEPDRTDWSSTATRAAENGGHRDELAEILACPSWTFEALGCGWLLKKGCWSVPERDAAGQILGISCRYPDNHKGMLYGSKRGLTYSDNALQFEGPVLICEGMSDAAAGTAMTIATVGRPSNVGGVDLLVELLAEIPVDREIIVIGERDQKPDGRWPGKTGAIETARKLADRLRRDVTWCLLPDDAKDLREWFASHAGGGDLKDLLLSKLEPECPSSSKGPGSYLDQLGQDPPELPAFKGYDCGRGRTIFQQAGDNPRAHRSITVACRSRTCPVCGPIWTEQRLRWYSWLICQQDRLFVAEIPRKEWSTLAKRIQRAGGSFVVVEVSAGKGCVLTTANVEGTLEVTRDEADAMIREWIVKARPVLKPVHCSRDWRLPSVKKVKQQSSRGDLADKPKRKWKSVRELKRLDPQRLIAGLEYAGVKYELGNVHAGGNFVVHWVAPEGADLETLYDKILEGTKIENVAMGPEKVVAAFGVFR